MARVHSSSSPTQSRAQQINRRYRQLQSKLGPAEKKRFERINNAGENGTKVSPADQQWFSGKIKTLRSKASTQIQKEAGSQDKVIRKVTQRKPVGNPSGFHTVTRNGKTFRRKNPAR